MATRKRWMLQPMSWRRGGLVALVVLVLVAALALVLDSSAGGEFDPVLELAESRGVEPIDLVVAQGRASRILLLSDAPGRAAPKRLAAEAIGRLVDGPGLDAVVLAVPSTEQPYIDAYLGDEAVSLLDRPRSIHEDGGVSRDYLRIYEAVRTANRRLPASRRLRIIAADSPDWPPAGIAPRAMAEAYSGRAEHMVTQIDRELFSLMPDARVLVFVDGYLTLQGTHGEFEVGGGDPIRVEWLGTLLRRRSGEATRTVLLDTGPRAEITQRVPAFTGTSLHRPLRRALDGPVGVRVQGPLAEVEDAVPGYATPGLTLRILPRGFRLGDAAQGYVYLNDR